jgi:glycosyltransferase involved in cell wall biosynthesis
MLKVLQICPKVPHPPRDGGSIAIDNITLGLLKRGHSVKVLAMRTPKHAAENALEDIDYLEKTRLETVFIDTGLKPIAALLNLLSNRSYNVERFYSRQFENSLIDILGREDFDLIIFESIYTAPYLQAVRRVTAAPAFLRAHNIEHHIWQGNCSLEKNPVKRTYLELLTRRLAHYEKDICNRFDAILPITDEDGKMLRSMGCTLPMETIPFGIDIENANSKKKEEYPSVFHLGAMDWRPNQDAMRWFLDETWPEVVKQFPAVKFYLAGRSIPEFFHKYASPNVEVVGEVPNAYDFMASKSIMVVPLFSGSGMRIKIVEGMALGKTIISTTLGACGINCENGRHMLIADTREEFVQHLQQTLSNQNYCDEIGKNAKDFAHSELDNNRHIDRLLSFYSVNYKS